MSMLPPMLFISSCWVYSTKYTTISIKLGNCIDWHVVINTRINPMQSQSRQYFTLYQVLCPTQNTILKSFMLVFSKLPSSRSCFGTLKMRVCVKINLDQSVGIHKIIWTTKSSSCFSNLLKCSTCSMFSYFVDLDEILYTKGIITLHRL